MNISSHTFVPSISYPTGSGNYLSRFDYYSSLGFFGTLFPFDGGTYTYRLRPSTSLVTITTSKVPLIPYYVSDISNPRNFVLLIY